MSTTSTVGLKIKNREVFGIFCAALSEDHVTFTHAGFYTILLTQTQLDGLPGQSNKLLEKLKHKKLVELFSVTPLGKRPPLPSPEEAERLLRKFTKHLAKGASCR
jgi:hypothetical protein